MQIVTRLISMSRSIKLNRQLREVEKTIHALPLNVRKQLAELTLKELTTASKCEFPHLYGTPVEQQRYQLWGAGTDIGFARMKSENPVVRIRGIALWFTVAYHETKESPYAEIQNVQRQLMRILRELKDAIKSTSPAQEINQWLTTAA